MAKKLFLHSFHDFHIWMAKTNQEFFSKYRYNVSSKRPTIKKIKLADPEKNILKTNKKTWNIECFLCEERCQFKTSSLKNIVISEFGPLYV